MYTQPKILVELWKINIWKVNSWMFIFKVFGENTNMQETDFYFFQ